MLSAISQLLRRAQQRPRIPSRLNAHKKAAFFSAFSKTKDEADYVIVGGGSAGCVLAKRLSDHGHSVIMLEAGESDVNKWDSWKISMPAALTYNLSNEKYNWNYYTVPQENCNNRRIVWPRGKVLGGSSSLNAMVYIRGHALDYDRWAAQGAGESWNYAHVLPYFKKSQTHALGGDAYRGGDGPLHVSQGSQLNSQPLFNTFIEAGVQAGYPKTSDINGFQQEGFGPMDMTIHNGARWNSASAYLRTALNPELVSVQTNVFVNKIIFDGKTATGVQVDDTRLPGTSSRTIKATKEIILSAGAINSPQLLMLSGVGPKQQLSRMNIPLVHNLPGVGENLQDHLDLYVQYQCTQPITLHHATWKYPHKMIQIATEYFLNQSGWGATAHLESGGFIRSRAGKSHPDLQYHFLPGALTGQLTPGTTHAMQAHVSPMRATSIGNIQLATSNPRAYPHIDPKYLSTQEDIDELRAGVKLTRELFEQKAFEPYRGLALSPGTADFKTDAALDAWVRSHTESAYHPSCTNKMGSSEDPMAVTAPDTSVYGLSNIRIVDASIMPSIISGNLNACVMMMAEKASDVILNKPALRPLIEVPVYESKDWENTQR